MEFIYIYIHLYAVPANCNSSPNQNSFTSASHCMVKESVYIREQAYKQISTLSQCGSRHAKLRISRRISSQCGSRHAILHFHKPQHYPTYNTLVKGR